MKVLMYGFGSGNNIEPWLEFFQKRSDKFQLTFVCKSFHFDRNRFHHIRIREIGSRIPFNLKFRSELRKEQYDVLYIQGLYDYLNILCLYFFVKTRYRVVNIWNNVNYKKATFSNKFIWQIPLYRIILFMTNRFYFTWYGTYTGFFEKFPKLKSKLFIQPWGIRSDIIHNPASDESDTVKQILNKLSSSDIFLFWPEYMSEDEYIHLFLEALTKIKNKSSLRVLLFSGHQLEETEYIRNLRKFVKDHNLTFVEIITGTYLPYQDIMRLWKRTDLTLKLSTKDQLSNGIIEALFFENPVILNDWLPYQKLKDEGMHVILTSLNSEDIARNIDDILDKLQVNRNYYAELGTANRKLVVKNFNFDANMDNLMHQLLETISSTEKK